ncbi:MAG: hypothetical protein KGI04_05040, partial [Candidatus Micrarchaeota archaeon]|nr:hypothetical protein [Candidatus Micrarchaeota archaeon]
TPGQSFTFMQNPATYKVTFAGDTLGSNFDGITIASGYASSIDYANGGTQQTANAGVTQVTDITEPSQTLTVTSSIPSAFTSGGFSGSQAVYVLTPYNLNEIANSQNTVGTTVGAPANVLLNLTTGSLGGYAANQITSSQQLTVTVYGASKSGGAITQTQVSFGPITTGNTLAATTANIFNVTGIKLNRAIPGVNIYVGSQGSSFNGNVVFSSTVNAANVPALGNPAVASNIVVSSTPGTANAITFSGSVLSGGQITASGYVNVNSVAVVNSISGSNTLILSGNLVVSGSIAYSGGSGTVTIAGNIPISNTIAYTGGTAISSNVFVSGQLTVTSSTQLSGPLSLAGNVVYTANIPTATTNTASEATVLIPPNVLQVNGASTQLLADLLPQSPQVEYQLAGKSYLSLASGSSLTYNQQNGQSTTTFALSANNAYVTASKQQQFFTYTMN